MEKKPDLKTLFETLQKVYVSLEADNLADLTVQNDAFRNVIQTEKHLQLVLMTLKPGEAIGMEVHEDTDQFFRVEKGEVVVQINGKEILLKEEGFVIVPEGSKHNVINRGKEDAKLYTLYSPPHHDPGKYQMNKEDEPIYLDEKQRMEYVMETTKPIRDMMFEGLRENQIDDDLIGKSIPHGHCEHHSRKHMESIAMAVPVQVDQLLLKQMPQFIRGAKAKTLRLLKLYRVKPEQFDVTYNEFLEFIESQADLIIPGILASPKIIKDVAAVFLKCGTVALCATAIPNLIDLAKAVKTFGGTTLKAYAMCIALAFRTIQTVIFRPFKVLFDTALRTTHGAPKQFLQMVSDTMEQMDRMLGKLGGVVKYRGVYGILPRGMILLLALIEACYKYIKKLTGEDKKEMFGKFKNLLKFLKGPMKL